MLHGKGTAMGEVLAAAQPRSILFTGSSRVAEKIAGDFKGKVRNKFAPMSTFIFLRQCYSRLGGYDPSCSTAWLLSFFDNAIAFLVFAELGRFNFSR
jgi:hypothetical protein